MALLFTRNFLGLILLQCKRSNLKEKTKNRWYLLLPSDPNGVEAVRNEIKKELGEKVNTQENSTTKRNPLLLQIRTLTRKRRKKRIRIRTKHQLIPSFYECSCRVDYEKSAIKQPNRMRFGCFLFIKMF